MKSLTLMNAWSNFPGETSLTLFTMEFMEKLDAKQAEVLGQLSPSEAFFGSAWDFAIKAIHLWMLDEALAITKPLDMAAHPNQPPESWPLTCHVQSVYDNIDSNTAIPLFTKAYFEFASNAWAAVHAPLERVSPAKMRFMRRLISRLQLMATVESFWDSAKPGTKAKGEYRIVDGAALLKQRIMSPFGLRIGFKLKLPEARANADAKPSMRWATVSRSLQVVLLC